MSDFSLDPYLNLLHSKSPALFKELYNCFVKVIKDNPRTAYGYTPDEGLFGPILSNPLTPSEFLIEIYEFFNKNAEHKQTYGILKAPSCPRELISEALNATDKKAQDSSYQKYQKDQLYDLVHNPSLSKDDLIKLSQHSEEILADWAKFYLNKDNPETFDDYLIESIHRRPYQISKLILEGLVTDATVEKILAAKLEGVSSSNYDNKTVGQLLLENPKLSDSSRAALTLLGFKSTKPERSQHEFPYFLTSLAFPRATPHLKPDTPRELLLEICSLGHPFGVLVTDSSVVEISKTQENLHQLFHAEYLHRMFWSELVGVDDFQLDYRNGYRVEDQFVDHKTISQRWHETDYEDGHLVGGVLAGYEGRDWILIERELEFDDCVRVMTNSYDLETEFSELLYDVESLTELYPRFLAYMYSDWNPIDFEGRYGVTDTPKAKEVISGAAYDFAESDDETVTSSLSPIYEEVLSWKKLPLEKKEQLIELLAWGLLEENSYISNTCEHFLACAALHPDTSEGLISKLRNTGNEIVLNTLERRG